MMGLESPGRHFILQGREVVPVTLMEWAVWLEKPGNNLALGRHVGDKYAISTVFLGLDYSLGEGPPQLFETMVFEQANWDGVDADRCSTYDEAEKMHMAMVLKWDDTARLIECSDSARLLQ